MNSIFQAVRKKEMKKKRMRSRIYLICSFCGERYLEEPSSTDFRLMNEEEYNKFFNEKRKKKLDADRKLELSYIG